MMKVCLTFALTFLSVEAVTELLGVTAWTDFYTKNKQYIAAQAATVDQNAYGYEIDIIDYCVGGTDCATGPHDFRFTTTLAADVMCNVFDFDLNTKERVLLKQDEVLGGFNKED